MSAVKYTNDCTTISSAVLSEVLRYVRGHKVNKPLLTVATLLEFFQPLGSSLLQKERPKSSKGFSLTGRLLGLSNNIIYHHNLAVRKNHWGMSSLTRGKPPMR